MNIKSAILWLLTSYRGSNNLSLWVRKQIEKKPIQELIGIPLASLAFFGAVVVPQTQSFLASTEVYVDSYTAPNTTLSIVPTETLYRWPITRFGMSQGFSSFHQGLDMTDPQGTPVFPITEGVVLAVETLPWGYGRHIVVSHDQGINSTYAHLSKANVSVGQKVTKDTEIGQVGSTGWSTGDHLHLEIHQNGAAINPVEVLPELKKFQTNEEAQKLDVSAPSLSL